MRRPPTCYGWTYCGRPWSTELNRQPAPSAHEEPASADASSDDQSRIGALEELILKRLDDDKAQDIIFIDLKDKSSVADGLIVASGRSHRHGGALADHLLRTLKDHGYGRARVEGLLAWEHQERSLLAAYARALAMGPARSGRLAGAWELLAPRREQAVT